MSPASGTVSRAPRPSSLADVLDLILDKGLVIDAYVRVSVVGIEILTIDARIVVASVDTYLHFAEAVNRLDLPATETQGLTELFGGQSGQQEDQDGRGETEDRQGDGAGEDHESHREVTSGQADESEGQEEGSGGDQGDREPSLAQRLVERGRWHES
jgi:hypothetical protein